jgi:hypothetical protein
MYCNAFSADPALDEGVLEDESNQRRKQPCRIGTLAGKRFLGLCVLKGNTSHPSKAIQSFARERPNGQCSGRKNTFVLLFYIFLL